MANSERTFPAAWITPGMDMTLLTISSATAGPLVGDDMISLPLIDGRQRLTRF